MELYVDLLSSFSFFVLQNSSSTAASSFPRNSTRSQGFMAVFESCELVKMTESTYKRLSDSAPQMLFSMISFGNFPLSQFFPDLPPEQTKLEYVLISIQFFCMQFFRHGVFVFDLTFPFSPALL